MNQTVIQLCAALVVVAFFTVEVQSTACFVEGFRGNCFSGSSCFTGGESAPAFCAEGETCCYTKRQDCRQRNNGATTMSSGVTIDSIVAEFSGADPSDQLTRYCCASQAGQRDCNYYENLDPAWRADGNPHSDTQLRWGKSARHCLEDLSTTNIECPMSKYAEDNAFWSQSGLGFQPSASKTVNIDENFELGTFTHYNFLIYGNSVKPSSTIFSVELALPGGQRKKFTYPLQIDETPNSEGKCLTRPLYTPVGNTVEGSVACPDRIWLNAGTEFGTGDTNITVEGSQLNYTLRIIGFKNDVCDDGEFATNNYVTQEKAVNQAILYGRITARCPACPVGVAAERQNDMCVCLPVIEHWPTPAGTPLRPPGTITPVTPPPKPGGSDIGAVAGGVGGTLLLVVLAGVFLLRYNEQTTGSYFRAKKAAPDTVIAGNPLYEVGAAAAVEKHFDDDEQ